MLLNVHTVWESGHTGNYGGSCGGGEEGRNGDEQLGTISFFTHFSCRWNETSDFSLSLKLELEST